MSVAPGCLRQWTTLVLATSLFFRLSTASGAHDGPVMPGSGGQTTVIDDVPQPLQDPARLRDTPLPENLLVSGTVRLLVKSMWQRSPTFRRQCARLRQHPDVMVSIERAVGVDNGSGRSRMKRHADRLAAVALIELRRPESYVELIAHELEHVLEQIDGLDLPRLTRQRLDGVVESEGRYETVRAQSVGRAVAREVMLP